MSNKLIVILGQTAAGKTGLSIKLAKKFNGAVVSADSRQVYRRMDIGTGKVTKKEMSGIPHFLLDVASPKRRFSVAQFQQKAIKAINQIIKQGKIPLLVGGSPFYIYAVIEGWVFPKLKTNWQLRRKLEKKTTDELFVMLKKLDARRAKTIEAKNKRRLIRAIEVASILGKVPLLKKDPQFECLIIGVQKSREELRNLIHQRLLKRIKQGMIAEVKRLRANDVSWSRLDSFGLEYRWISRYLQGKITKQEMIKFLEADILVFSKRQMTWFKKDPSTKWVTTYSQAEKLVKEFLK